MCLIGGVEKWEGGKLFYLVGKKNEKMENVIYINWLLYSYYIIVGKWERKVRAVGECNKVGVFV